METDNGNVDAMNLLVSLIKDNEWIQVDVTEACKYCKMAVDNNSVKAMKKYSEMLVKCNGSLKKDTIKASYYFQIITKRKIIEKKYHVF